jgi:LuxR family maltose regulon positive regulatory protein
MGEQIIVPADAEDSLDTGPLEPLTDMETKILERVALGRSNKELAEQMSLSINTVRHHLRSIHSKLGVKRRTEAVAIGRRYGLIK